MVRCCLQVCDCVPVWSWPHSHHLHLLQDWGSQCPANRLYQFLKKLWPCLESA
jgi:hypothetical protein